MKVINTFLLIYLPFLLLLFATLASFVFFVNWTNVEQKILSIIINALWKSKTSLKASLTFSLKAEFCPEKYCKSRL